VIQNHPDNNPSNDDRRVDNSVEITVDDSIIEHQRSGAAGSSRDGQGNAGEAVEQRLRDDAETLPEAQPASRNRDVDHRKHRPTISARRASSGDDQDDAATVKGTVRGVGLLSGITSTTIESAGKTPPKTDRRAAVSEQNHLSGIELVGIESAGKTPPKTHRRAAAKEQNHLSGTISPFANTA
jgi:hypothetical protein